MVLQSSDAILQRRLPIIRRNKALLRQVIEEQYPDLLEWHGGPTAGAICFVQFKGPLTSMELGRVLAQHGVSIKPAYCFVPPAATASQSMTGDNNDQHPAVLFQDYFRIGFGEDKMPLALEQFVKVMELYKDEWRRTMMKEQQGNA